MTNALVVHYARKNARWMQFRSPRMKSTVLIPSFVLNAMPAGQFVLRMRLMLDEFRVLSSKFNVERKDNN